MFYKFTSDCVYSETDWPEIFELETLIHGALCEYVVVYASLSESELCRRISRFIRWAYREQGWSYRKDFSSILRLQIPYIMVYLGKHKHDIECHNNTFLTDSLRMDLFQACLKSSPTFRQCVIEKGGIKGDSHR